MPDSIASANLPLVTIVVSCFNHERYIEACLDSILAQTYKNIELIVYDDGSSDASAERIGKLASEHDFFFRAQENAGFTANLNDALRRASGAYFCTVGSDDILMPDKTAKQVSFLERHQDIAMCTGNKLTIDEHGKLHSQQEMHPAETLYFQDLFQPKQLHLSASTTMIRRNVLLEIGGFRDDIPLEDLYLWLKLTRRGYGIHALNDVLLYYRQHGNNTFTNLDYMYDSITKILAEYRDEPLYENVLSRFALSYCHRALRRGNKKLAARAFRDIAKSDYNLKLFRRFITYMAKP